MDDRRKWQIASTVASIAAVGLVRYGIRRAWSASRDAPPPDHPARDGASWGKAVAWTLSLGAVGGLARLAGREGVAAAWRTLTGRDVPA